MIDEALARRPIEQLPIPFAALATDVANGAPVELRRGPTGVAVAASSAIPVIFEPVPLNGRSLVDGSLCQPVPIDVTRELGADLMLAVDVAYRPSDVPARGLIDMPFQMMHIMINALITEQIARADLRIQLDLHRLMLDISDPAPLIRAGEEAVERIWPELQRLLRA
jgi:NTE family protein